jgi:hypothetical protein
MLVWGGSGGSDVYADGASYDPVSDTWAAIASPGDAVGRQRHQALWTGTQMLIYGGNDSADDPIAGGLAYDPATDTWEEIPPDPLGTLDTRYVEWTGTRMLLVGYADGREPDRRLARLALYDPEARAWQAISGVALSRYNQPRPIATTDAVLLVGSQPPAVEDGSPTSVIIHQSPSCWRSPMVAAPANDAFLGPVWSGSLLIWPGQHGVAYEPAADQWWTLPEAPGNLANRDAVPSVWAGDRVLVWSGLRGESGEPLDDGAVFIP